MFVVGGSAQSRPSNIRATPNTPGQQSRHRPLPPPTAKGVKVATLRCRAHSPGGGHPPSRERCVGNATSRVKRLGVRHDGTFLQYTILRTGPPALACRQIYPPRCNAFTEKPFRAKVIVETVQRVMAEHVSGANVAGNYSTARA